MKNITRMNDKKTVCINIDHHDVMDGGTYMIVLEDLPLYIGETNYFLERFSNHLYKIKNKDLYLGLRNVDAYQKISLIILNDKLSNDEVIRKKQQDLLIDKYRPITQQPIFYDNNELKKMKNVNKKDNIIKNNMIDEVVKDALDNHKQDYDEITKEIINLKKGSSNVWYI